MSTEDTYKTKLSPASIIAQLVTIGLLIFFWKLGQKWVSIPAVLFIMFLFLFLPRIIKKKEAQFHKDALRLLATGKAVEVPDLARRQFLLQLFGSSAPIDAKLGLAYVQINEYPSVIPCMDNAIPLAPPSERPALQSALTKALFVTGDPARAETEGRFMLEKGGTRLPEIMVMVARARMGLGKADQMTANFLAQATEFSPGDDVALMLQLAQLELDMAHGKKAGDVPDDSGTTQPFLRTWTNYVRGKVKEKTGNRESAKRSYAKAVKLGKEDNCWFANLARERLDALMDMEGAPGEQDNVDPAMRRKKKKRR